MNKVQKINLSDKGSLNQYLQGLLFTLCAWNAGSGYGTDITWSVLSIGIELPFLIFLSPEMSEKGTSQVHQDMDHFEAASPLIFIQRYLFIILVSDQIPRHYKMRNKGKHMIDFDAGYILVAPVTLTK